MPARYNRVPSVYLGCTEDLMVSVGGGDSSPSPAVAGWSLSPEDLTEPRPRRGRHACRRCRLRVPFESSYRPTVAPSRLRSGAAPVDRSHSRGHAPGAVVPPTTGAGRQMIWATREYCVGALRVASTRTRWPIKARGSCMFHVLTHKEYPDTAPKITTRTWYVNP